MPLQMKITRTSELDGVAVFSSVGAKIKKKRFQDVHRV